MLEKFFQNPYKPVMRNDSIANSDEENQAFIQSHEPPSTKRTWVSSVAIVAILLLTNVLTFLSVWQWRHYTSEDLCKERLGAFRRHIDRTIRPYQSNDFDLSSSMSDFHFNFTKYTTPTDISGDEVEKNWADLGIYTSPILVPVKDAALYDLDQDRYMLLDDDECVSLTIVLSSVTKFSYY